MYGFACYMEDNQRKCLVLPKKYKEWITDFNYPLGFVKMRTTNGQVFEVKVYELANFCYFYNGWYSVVETLKLQSGSWLVFQYEEALSSFRIFYFYDNIEFAPSDYFYYRPNGAFDKPDAMHINRLFVHHKMDNTIPNYPVVIRGPGKLKVFVRIEVFDNQLYITTGWDRIKKKLSITDEHMLVFEMIDLHNFDMFVFNCSKNADLVLPPELYAAAVKEEIEEDVISISDAEDVDEVSNRTEANMLPVARNEETIPIVFRVDNHFRIKKHLAKKIGLDRKRCLKIVDAEGNVWDWESRLRMVGFT
ncbi:putative transcription factor B3-Domain family [Helianthus annuus]|uniref:Transcription factor B3-Domain family n=1 Tax=Helianthus annuus TaxID=4232 RepID=A0A9K3JVV5_HELAN|nr:putative transcription factor B3-Domain family [Helianthus annuus]